MVRTQAQSAKHTVECLTPQAGFLCNLTASLNMFCACSYRAVIEYNLRSGVLMLLPCHGHAYRLEVLKPT